MKLIAPYGFIMVKKLFDSQTTHGLDFTRIKCMQLEGPTAPCRFPDVPAKCSWKWKDIIDLEYDKRPASLIYTVATWK